MNNRKALLALAIILFMISACTKSAIENTVDALTPDIDPQEQVDNDGNNDQEEEADPVQEEEEEEVLGNLSAIVNTQEFNATRSIIGPYLVSSVNILDNGYLLNIFAVDLQLSANTTKFINIYVAGFDFNDLKVGSTFETANPFSLLGYEPGIFAIYGEDLNTEDEIDGYDTDALTEIYFEVTALDKEKQRISGKFNFIGTSEETETVFNVSDGEFIDVTYELNQ